MKKKENISINNYIRSHLQKKGPSVETDWPLTIACHMKIRSSSVVFFCTAKASDEFAL